MRMPEKVSAMVGCWAMLLGCALVWSCTPSLEGSPDGSGVIGPPHGPPVGPGQVRRVRLSIRPNDVQVIDEILVESMTLLPMVELPDQPLLGFWFEAQDEEGTVLYRTLAEDPTYFELEVPHGSGRIEREPMKDKAVVVDVALPLLPAITDLVLFSSFRFGDDQELLPSTELARVTLRPPEDLIPPEGDAPASGDPVAVPLLENGPQDEQVNLLIVAEGFRAGKDQELFEEAAEAFANRFQDLSWYARLGASFNIYSLGLVSTQSGADDPASCGDGTMGTGTLVDTVLDAEFCAGGGTRRVLRGDEARLMEIADLALPQWVELVVLVNSDVYGGSGTYQVAWASLGADPLGLILHEMGHAIFLLGDEYCCGGSNASCFTAPPNVEHAAINVTAATSAIALDWGALVDGGVSIPTMQHPQSPDCSFCDPTSDIHGDIGLVGLYEGAGRYNCGFYRPTFGCRMRSLGREFCRLCVELAASRLAGFQPGQP